MIVNTTSAEVRYWKHVIVNEEGCWGWRGATHSFGYGQIGRERGAGLVNAHRLSWEIHNGPIPDGLSVLHRCDNPPCSRPDHLFLGTQGDNMRDAATKGRIRLPNVVGEANPASKLTAALVSEIRERVAAGVSGAAIAREIGVHPSTVQRAAKGVRWAA